VQQIELPTNIHDMLEKRRLRKHHHKHHHQPHHRTGSASNDGEETMKHEIAGEKKVLPNIVMSNTGDFVEASKDASTAIFYPLSPSHPPHGTPLS